MAGLDPVITAELYGLIDRLNREQGITVIVVTHDVHSAVQCGNKILHMDTRAVFFGTREEYLMTEVCRRMMGVHTHAGEEGEACHAGELLSYPFIVRALVVGTLVALCAALLGVSLVLKRYSMIGDGLSHVGFRRCPSRWR